MKALWLIPVLVLGVAWWMRKAANAKTRNAR
jgi:hypothetical protein